MLRIVTVMFALVAASATFLAYPSIYPTGTTIYTPQKAWSGYTVFGTPGFQGAVLIDMNGTVVKRWKEVAAEPGPFRILPGGYVMGGTVRREPHQEAVALVQVDWNNRIVWKFDRAEQVQTRDKQTIWASRQHHDWQREGSAVGYFAPGATPLVDRGRTLILTHTNVTKAEITDKRLEDDRLIEVSWGGQILWDWIASDHVAELGFSEEARNTIHRFPNWNENRQSADWLHINAASYVGPNRWHDQGDQRFHPDNIIVSLREANIVAIVERKSGGIVWRMGPDYRLTKPLGELGQIIGQHHPHIIPVGLPGAGHLLVFDNGGAAGYGASSPSAPTGRLAEGRFNSRVLEINPVTLEKVWEYTLTGNERFRFFSHYVSSAQRLPNGNTLVTEGAVGRVFELTATKEIVWEYVNPFIGEENGVKTFRIYRAHRVPYDWVPQAPRPVERAVVPPDITEFRVPAVAP